MSKNNKLWGELCTIKSLKKGWHLTRIDMQQDFIQEPFSKETFGYFHEKNLDELLRIIKTDKYTPDPLKRISIPKGTLGTRPGTLLSIEDRIILFSALSLIADPLDRNLGDGVYSYRVKKQSGNSGSLFYEGDALSLPFLKNKTIKKYIDPFDPWYGLWPKFEQISREAFKEKGYQYMATSDIAAYFENIQIDLLREQLHNLLPTEQKITNLFMTAFSAWTYDTEQGRRYMRGIPQGSQISSFFGNLFLKPIDDAFSNFGNKYDVEYFRYMDDVRIFTKSYDVARGAILLLDSEVRRLHLNLQTAKTKILDENDGEITALLIDRRISQIDKLQDALNKELNKEVKDEARKPDFSDLLTQSKKILNQEPEAITGSGKIKGSRKPLKGMNDRVFRRLLTLHLAMRDDSLVANLIKEMRYNADSRIGAKLIRYGQEFPRKTTLQTKLFEFIKERGVSFPYQEAQILEALRYQSRIKQDLIQYCLKLTKDIASPNIVTMQALKLIARCILTKNEIKIAQKCFDNFDDLGVKKSAALILIRQRGKLNNDFVKSIVLHPNDEIRKYGRLISTIKNDSTRAKQFIDQPFKRDYLMVDHIPFFYLIAESKNTDLVKHLIKTIRNSQKHNNHENMDMRDHLKKVVKYGTCNLRPYEPTSD